MKSYQNLVLLQNLYRLKSIGFEYIDPFSVNTTKNDIQNYSTPNSLIELNKNIANCYLCDLSKSRSQSMSGYGNPNADLMIIDYSVSQAQDSTKNYFTGRSGEILKNMIENVLKLSTEDIFLSHAIKCKPLKSNKPSPSEWNSCKSYLHAQLEFIKPRVIVTLGSDAYAKLTNDNDNFENVRGHVIDFQNYKLIPIYHPSHLLRNPELKKIAMSDLKTIKSCL